jgi:hypothetical protein
MEPILAWALVQNGEIIIVKQYPVLEIYKTFEEGEKAVDRILESCLRNGVPRVVPVKITFLVSEIKPRPEG